MLLVTSIPSDSVDIYSAWAVEWQSWAKTHTSAPFMGPEWASAVACLGPRPNKVWAIADSGGSLRMIASLEEVSLLPGLGRGFSFPGGWLSDANDFLFAPDTSVSEREDAVEQLLDGLVPWTVLLLRELPADSPTLALINTVAQKRGLRVEVRPSAPVPHVDTMSTDWAGYLKSRSKRFRRSLSGAFNRWRTLGYTYRVADWTTEESITAVLTACRDIETRSHKRDSQRLLADADRTLQLFRTLARSGLLHCGLVYHNEQPIAYLLCLSDGDSLHAYATAYAECEAWGSPGTMLFYEAIRGAFHGCISSRVSLGRGNIHHKRRWATGCSGRVNVRIYSQGIQALTVQALLRLRSRLSINQLRTIIANPA